MFPQEERWKVTEIMAELHKARGDFQERQGRRSRAAGPTGGAHPAGASLDSDQRQRFRQELEMLKSKP
eukprot:g4423.t1